jgi:hypothetical protein
MRTAGSSMGTVNSYREIRAECTAEIAITL